MSDYSSIGQLNKNNSQTQGFAAAVQRAKLVAAKIEVGAGGKRPLEDIIESTPAKKIAGIESGSLYQTSPMSATATSRMSGGGLGPGGPPSQSDIPVNEYIRVPDEMVGLIIGRRGEQITRLQAETGCKIQMAPDSGGLPERVCTITGSREAVNRAKDLVNNIVNQRGAPGMDQGGPPGGQMPPQNMMRNNQSGHCTEEMIIPGNKVGLIIGKGGETIKQLQERSGAKMVIIQDGPNPEFEKPLRISGDASKVEHAKQLVFELLSEREMQNANRRPQQQHGSEYDEMDSNSLEVMVPQEAVGLVIGAGGFMIKNIQAKTGCKVQFHQEKNEPPGDKRCILQGSPQQIAEAKEMIDDLIDSMNGVRRGGPGGGNPRGGQRNGGGGGDFNGRGGGGGGGGGGPNNWGDNSGEPKVTATFTVTSVKCSQIIGRGGEVIRQIIAQSGAHVELDRRANQNDRNARPFVIRGHPDAVESAKRIIVEKCGGAPINFMPEGGNGNGQMGGNGGGGGPTAEQYYGGGGAPAWGYNPHWHPANSQPQTPAGVSINPSTGQPDYSQQWIDYYRSQGMHREADAIEQQANKQAVPQQPQSQPQQQVPQQQPARGGGPQANPATAAASAAGGADYSAQWAEYYRAIGKVKEAEAIEAQLKQKQSAPTVASPVAQSGPAAGNPAAAYGAQPAPGPYPPHFQQFYAPQGYPQPYPDQQ